MPALRANFRLSFRFECRNLAKCAAGTASRQRPDLADNRHSQPSSVLLVLPGPSDYSDEELVDPDQHGRMPKELGVGKPDGDIIVSEGVRFLTLVLPV